MTPLTSKERIARTLDRKEIDHIGLKESFWHDTRDLWVSQGHIGAEESLEDHFGHDIRAAGWINIMCDPTVRNEVLEETEETRLTRNPNGAVLRWHKQHSSTPEHVDFLVQDRSGWEEHIRPKLLDESLDLHRANFESYRKIREKCIREDLFFVWSGVNVFESIHPMCGHEYMLMGMALDPEWVADMCDVYSDVILRVQTKLFDEVGPPDAVFYYEDMGFKERPFMSPAMYRDLVQPAHAKTFDFAHNRGLKVIVHSCGFVEPLVPGMIEAGMDMLQAMEVKAGMDLVHLKKTFGDKIGFMGGLDVRPLTRNDFDAIEAELQAKIPAAMEGGGYVLHTDHSIPTQVDYETYKFFVKRGIEIGTY
ncbi:MAG: uroporphyrinogen decarboxylase family protein [Phycisphaerae bacterium]